MVDFTALFVGVFSVLPFLVQRFTGKFIYFAIFSLIAIGAHGMYFYGPNILYALGLTYVISTVAELLSLKTPINCFGVTYRYDVHHKFFSSRVRFLGVYPLEVSIAWVIFKYISINIGLLIVSAFSLAPFWEILLIPFILMSVDFIIDPVAVHITKLWRWERGGIFFGIPWQNFLGWYMVGLFSTISMVSIGSMKPLSFHYLLWLPILFYGFMVKNVPSLMRLDKRMGMLAAIPVVGWTLLGIVSLILISYR